MRPYWTMELVRKKCRQNSFTSARPPLDVFPFARVNFNSFFQLGTSATVVLLCRRWQFWGESDVAFKFVFCRSSCFALLSCISSFLSHPSVHLNHLYGRWNPVHCLCTYNTSNFRKSRNVHIPAQNSFAFFLPLHPVPLSLPPPSERITGVGYLAWIVRYQRFVENQGKSTLAKDPCPEIMDYPLSFWSLIGVLLRSNSRLTRAPGMWWTFGHNFQFSNTTWAWRRKFRNELFRNFNTGKNVGKFNYTQKASPNLLRSLIFA